MNQRRTSRYKDLMQIIEDHPIIVLEDMDQCETSTLTIKNHSQRIRPRVANRQNYYQKTPNNDSQKMLTIFIVIVFLCLCGLVTLFTNNSQASKATKVAKAPKIIQIKAQISTQDNNQKNSTTYYEFHNDSRQKIKQVQEPQKDNQPQQQAKDAPKKQIQNQETGPTTNKVFQHEDQGDLNKQKVDVIINIPKYKKFNYNLAHYLLEKKNISHLMCLDCSQQSLQHLKSRKYYQKMTINRNHPQNKNYWIHGRRNHFFKKIQEVDKLLSFIKKTKSQFVKGFSIFWKERDAYMNVDQLLTQYLTKQMAAIGFHYIEPVSLGLRYMEEGIIMVFQKEVPAYKALPFDPPKKVIGYQSVFRMAQNIPFLREYLLYHIKVGISRIYLYDNDGTQTDDWNQSSAALNKYSLNLSCIGLSQEKKVEIFDEIWEEFEEYIIYIPWQPLKNGKIYYEQVGAGLNYIYYYKQVTKWTIYIDFDEYLYSPKELDIIDYVLKKQKQGISHMVVQHFKLQSRFCIDGHLVVEGFLSMGIKNLAWSPKLLISNEATLKFTVHTATVKFGRRHEINPQEFKFYHYNMLQDSFKWGRQVNYVTSKGTFIDDSMKKYVPMLKEYCKGKCSDNHKFACSIQERFLKTKCLELKDQV